MKIQTIAIIFLLHMLVISVGIVVYNKINYTHITNMSVMYPIDLTFSEVEKTGKCSVSWISQYLESEVSRVTEVKLYDKFREYPLATYKVPRNKSWNYQDLTFDCKDMTKNMWLKFEVVNAR